jgi:hypothetical protein
MLITKLFLSQFCRLDLNFNETTIYIFQIINHFFIISIDFKISIVNIIIIFKLKFTTFNYFINSI